MKRDYISGQNIDNINMMISPSKKRKHEGEEKTSSRPKLDIQILHDTEAAWLVDHVAAE